MTSNHGLGPHTPWRASAPSIRCDPIFQLRRSGAIRSPSTPMGASLNTNFTTKHGREGPAAAIVSDAQRQIIEGLWVA